MKFDTSLRDPSFYTHFNLFYLSGSNWITNLQRLLSSTKSFLRDWSSSFKVTSHQKKIIIIPNLINLFHFLIISYLFSHSPPTFWVINFMNKSEFVHSTIITMYIVVVVVIEALFIAPLSLPHSLDRRRRHRRCRVESSWVELSVNCFLIVIHFGINIVICDDKLEQIARMYLLWLLNSYIFRMLSSFSSLLFFSSSMYSYCIHSRSNQMNI